MNSGLGTACKNFKSSKFYDYNYLLSYGNNIDKIYMYFIENCPTRTSKEVNFNCISFGLPINCSKAVEGTVMEMTCKNNFSPPTQAICRNGFWSKPIISCQAGNIILLNYNFYYIINIF